VQVAQVEVNEVVHNARQLLKERTDSLQSDVRYCVVLNTGTQDWPAPLPALLYCFSTIDLLGALYAGDATNKASTTKQSKKYMVDIMRYPEEKADLLQQVFRHKIVHLAQLSPRININTSVIKERNLSSNLKVGCYTWAYSHNERGIHMSVEEKRPGEFRFRVSIWSLVEDIVDSVYKPNGYLHRLENNEEKLQDNFKNAYDQIFEH
jgi:hypothetical protein